MDFSVFAFCHATNCLCSILAFWPFLLLSLYYFSLLIFWRYSCFPLSFVLKFIFPLLTFFCPFHFLFSAMFSTLLSWLHFLLVFLSPILEFFHPFSFFITWVLLYGVVFWTLLPFCPLMFTSSVFDTFPFYSRLPLSSPPCPSSFCHSVSVVFLKGFILWELERTRQNDDEEWEEIKKMKVLFCKDSGLDLDLTLHSKRGEREKEKML